VQNNHFLLRIQLENNQQLFDIAKEKCKRAKNQRLEQYHFN
jgi:hypothetical protein